jgi:transposase
MEDSIFNNNNDNNNGKPGRGRRSFDKDFKLSAVKLIVEQGRTASSVSRALGISQNTLLHWKKNYLKDNNKYSSTNNTTISSTMRTANKTISENEEIQRLRKEIHNLSQERDILKKAIAVVTRPEK